MIQSDRITRPTPQAILDMDLPKWIPIPEELQTPWQKKAIKKRDWVAEYEAKRQADIQQWYDAGLSDKEGNPIMNERTIKILKRFYELKALQKKYHSKSLLHAIIDEKRDTFNPYYFDFTVDPITYFSGFRFQKIKNDLKVKGRYIDKETIVQYLPRDEYEFYESLCDNPEDWFE